MTISLKDGFRTPRAVVDWIEFVVELGRNSHGGYLKRTHEHLGVSQVKPIDKGAGSAASKFLIRLQHPASYAVIDTLLDDLNEQYGVIEQPALTGLEVSIDFAHKVADPDALRAMTERLMHSLTPPVIENPRVQSGGFDMSDGLSLTAVMEPPMIGVMEPV